MGGLVCRCFLQNDEISTPEDRALVDKVFTYATPHNGIEMAGINVPRFLGLWDMKNFNREYMAEYLGLDFKKEGKHILGKEEIGELVKVACNNVESCSMSVSM